MALTHTLNGTTINEPIGFDDMEVNIKRGEYHGMSAEVSVGTLEFYGNAYTIVKAAYDADIDTQVTYIVEDDGTQLFSGVLDLSTCEFQDSDYQSVSCKVGEIGAKTTFNNRTEVDVNLNSVNSINGTLIPSNKRASWYTIYIPTKQLCFTNKWSQTKVASIQNPSGIYWRFGVNVFAKFQLDTKDANEFGNAATGTIGEPIYTIDDKDEFEKTYGTGCSISASGSIKLILYYNVSLGSGWNLMSSTEPEKDTEATIISLSSETTILATYDGSVWKDYKGNTYNDVYAWNETTSSSGASRLMHFSVGIIREGSTSMSKVTVDILPTEYGTDTSVIKTFTLSGITADPEYSIYLAANATCDWNVYASSAKYYFEIETGSYLTFKMYDTIKKGSSNALCAPVGDVLYQICQSISDNNISLKSEFYGLTQAPQSASAIGDGALKFITNGYRIRGIYASERGISVSFKTMIEALNSQDCIGWGFSTESGTTYLRVERWSWFYKDDVVLTIVGANSIKRSVNTDLITTSFTIGYKKYETQSDYNSIDSIHGERTFVSKIAAVSNEESKLCEFIADNYAIEETRRASYECDSTEEFKYDENIFIFECQKRTGYNFEVATSATNVTGLDRPTEFINAMLSPRHMAARWRDYLFACNSTGALNFSSGTINYNVSFQVKSSTSDTTYLKDFAVSKTQSENGDISRVHASYTAETIEFEYPITIAQYKAIKANPYGLIIVNGIEGWIKEFSYKVLEGTGTFKLIPKYE